MKFFDNSKWEQEFALKAFTTSIESQDWTINQLKELLIQQKNIHMLMTNDLIHHLKIHGINAFCIYVENGGSNDVAWDFQYLNGHLANAFKEHITPRVGYYMAKAISEAKGV